MYIFDSYEIPFYNKNQLAQFLINQIHIRDTLGKLCIYNLNYDLIADMKITSYFKNMHMMIKMLAKYLGAFTDTIECTVIFG